MYTNIIPAEKHHSFPISTRLWPYNVCPWKLPRLLHGDVLVSPWPKWWLKLIELLAILHSECFHEAHLNPSNPIRNSNMSVKLSTPSCMFFASAAQSKTQKPHKSTQGRLQKREFKTLESRFNVSLFGHADLPSGQQFPYKMGCWGFAWFSPCFQHARTAGMLQVTSELVVWIGMMGTLGTTLRFTVFHQLNF